MSSYFKVKQNSFWKREPSKTTTQAQWYVHVDSDTVSNKRKHNIWNLPCKCAVTNLDEWSTQISSGQICHRRLRTLPRPTKIKWRTFGKHVQGHKGRCCLLLGASGSGKTCLMEALFNHLLGQRPDKNEKVYHITTEQQLSNHLKLKPTDVIRAYTLSPIDGVTTPLPFTVIDTPGLCGKGSDTALLKEIRDLLQYPARLGLPAVDVIYIVVQGSTTRITASEQNLFYTVQSCINTSVQQIQVVFTFSDGSTTNALEAVNEIGLRFSYSPYSVNNRIVTDTSLSRVSKLFMEQNTNSMDAMLRNFPIH